MRCECCGDELPADTSAWKVDVVGDGGTNLRGHFVGNIDELREFSNVMKPYGLVVASPMGPEDRR